MRHVFKFQGGEDLTTMGASWFVSYAYSVNVNSNHNNWKFVKTYPSRISVFNRTKPLHEFYLQEIIKMNDDNLNRNKLSLNAGQIKIMAKELLEKIFI